MAKPKKPKVAKVKIKKPKVGKPPKVGGEKGGGLAMPFPVPGKKKKKGLSEEMF
jgi:hypothetical protein